MVASFVVHAPPPSRAAEARAWSLRVFVWAGPGSGDAEQGLFATLRRRLPGRELALLRPGWDSPDPIPGVADLLVVPVRGGEAALAQQTKRALSERSPLSERFTRWAATVPLRFVETAAPMAGLPWSEAALELRTGGVLDGDGLCDAVEGLVGGIEGGLSVARAMDAANALVSARGGPSEGIQGTWTDAEEAAIALVSPPWRPLGWPTPAADAGRLLQEAWQLAMARHSGFVGVEHLVELLPRHAPGLPKRVSEALRLGRPALRHYAQLEPRARAAPNWDGTPRLIALGKSLKAEFTLADLARVLLSPASPLARALLDVPKASGSAKAALRLEVLGGPEDGRALVLAPGDHLGRGADLPSGLYRSTLRTDPWLSQRHLEWVGPGRVVLERTAMVDRAGGTEFLGPGICEVFEGDVLALTRATRVRGVGA